ncbi:MAG: acyltransferase [Lachnospiraceae bacterium]|nr:acyltransferase [Lachnospiraceae bacterium]
MDSKCINSLKGIGILGVVLVHCGLGVQDGILGSIAASGARGVQLLFIINAFLIFNSLEKIEFNRKQIIAWYKRKFIRLIPLYWFFTILHLLVFGLGERYYLGTLPSVSPLNILCNMLFLHGFHPYYIGSINANWFMADLAIFYVLAPLLYKLIDSLEKSVISLLIITPLGYILYHFALGWNVLEVKAIWTDYVTILSFLAEFPIILLGIFAYFMIKESHKWKNKGVISVVTLMFSLFCMVSLIMGKQYFIIFNYIFSFGVLFTVLFIGQAQSSLKCINNSLFALFGKHSYGIYLSHTFLLSTILNENYGGGVIGAFIRYCIVVAGALLIAVIAEKMIEQPAIRFINKKIFSGND